MNIQEVTNSFIDWVESKTQSDFSITNDFLLVCLEEAIELNMNSSFNGIKFFDYYDHDDFNFHILSSWKSSSNAFLKQLDSPVQINFKGVPVPTYEIREKLLTQLNELDLKCKK